MSKQLFSKVPFTQAHWKPSYTEENFVWYMWQWFYKGRYPKETCCHLQNYYGPPSEKVKKEYKCDVCQKSFVAPSQLKRHITVHKKTKDYTCNFCQKIFLVPSKLKRHLEVHENSGKK